LKVKKYGLDKLARTPGSAPDSVSFLLVVEVSPLLSDDAGVSIPQDQR